MKKLLITGAAGHVGKAVLAQPGLAKFGVFACDLSEIKNLPPNTDFRKMDVRGPQVEQVIGECKPDVVIHLASVVTPPKGSGRDFAFDVDVNGTRNVIEACLKHDVGRIVVTSSGAVYGYHPENVNPLREDDPIRGNYEFPYSHHKRLVEEYLSEVRVEYPQLEQVVFRVGTVLGVGLENQITALFHKPRLLGLTNNESPFVFIWDDDLAQILLHAAMDGPPGIYNVAGDGHLGVSDLAEVLGKPVLRFPAWVLKLVLAIASPFGASQYGPEQVRFLQYRPVLDNRKLKEEFGYVPQKTSLEAFKAWIMQAGL